MAMEDVLEKAFVEGSSSPTAAVSRAESVEEVSSKSDFFATIWKARNTSNQKTSPRQRAQSLVATWLTSETDSEDKDNSLDDATFLGTVE
jgi:hypothetical protein